jgi:glycosyltransferase involved in cell wall biosynthesis
MIGHTPSELLVVMPVYNAQPYLIESVDSILNQSLQNFDFLIIDDVSTDGSYEYLTKLVDPRIRLMRQTRGGPGAAMNLALEHALREGIPFIARMDADDVSAPRRLESQLALMKTLPTCAAISCNAEYINTKGEIIGNSTVPRSPNQITREINQGLRGLIQGACVFRVDALAAVGGYRNHILQAEDTDLFLRLSEKYQMANLGEFLYQIRVHTGSLSLAAVEQNIRYHVYALRCHHLRRAGQKEPTFTDYSQDLPFQDQLRLLEERLFLRFWRRGLFSSNIFYQFLAAVASPRRLFARVTRIMERKPQ